MAGLLLGLGVLHLQEPRPPRPRAASLGTMTGCPSPLSNEADGRGLGLAPTMEGRMVSLSSPILSSCARTGPRKDPKDP